MRRFDQHAAEMYWRDHVEKRAPLDFKRDPNALGNVCHPGQALQVNEYYAKYQARVYERLLARVPVGHSKANALEIGCGAARWCKMLSAHGYQVTGVDLQEALIAANRKQHPAMNFVCQSFDDFQAEPGHFSLVSSVTVLQHNTLSAQKRLIRKARTMLRRGGYALILENIRDQDEHVFANKPSEWINMFKEAGFSLREKVPYDYSVCLRACSFASHAANGMMQRLWRFRKTRENDSMGAGESRSVNGYRGSSSDPLRQAKVACTSLAARLDDKLETYAARLLLWPPPVHCGFLFEAVA